MNAPISAFPLSILPLQEIRRLIRDHGCASSMSAIGVARWRRDEGWLGAVSFSIGELSFLVAACTARGLADLIAHDPECVARYGEFICRQMAKRLVAAADEGDAAAAMADVGVSS